jgi:hypothetical protein
MLRYGSSLNRSTPEAFGFFTLIQDPARPRAVGVLPVLRDDALESQLAGVLEDGRPVAVDVLVELDPGARDLAQ